MDSTDNKTNRFHLPLFNICGSTFSNASLSVASAFLSSEDKESFKWVLARLQPPMTFVTDGDTKLIAAIRSLHPNSSHLIYIRHVCKTYPWKASSSCPKYWTWGFKGKDLRNTWTQSGRRWFTTGEQLYSKSSSVAISTPLRMSGC